MPGGAEKIFTADVFRDGERKLKLGEGGGGFKSKRRTWELLWGSGAY